MKKNILPLICTSILYSGCANIKNIESLAQNGDANAQYNLGFKYDTGIDVPRNHEKAMYWIKKSASQGNSSAQDYIMSQQRKALDHYYCVANDNGICIQGDYTTTNINKR